MPVFKNTLQVEHGQLKGCMHAPGEPMSVPSNAIHPAPSLTGKAYITVTVGLPRNVARCSCPWHETAKARSTACRHAHQAKTEATRGGSVSVREMSNAASAERWAQTSRRSPVRAKASGSRYVLSSSSCTRATENRLLSKRACSLPGKPSCMMMAETAARVGCSSLKGAEGRVKTQPKGAQRA